MVQLTLAKCGTYFHGQLLPFALLLIITDCVVSLWTHFLTPFHLCMPATIWSLATALMAPPDPTGDALARDVDHHRIRVQMVATGGVAEVLAGISAVLRDSASAALHGKALGALQKYAAWVDLRLVTAAEGSAAKQSSRGGVVQSQSPTGGRCCFGAVAASCCCSLARLLTYVYRTRVQHKFPAKMAHTVNLPSS